MKALRDLAVADVDIAALVDDRIFVNAIPEETIEDEDPRYPSKMLVLRQAGGTGSRDFLPVERPIITVLCYGESDLEANRVRLAVAERFKYLDRELVSGVLIHHINSTGGAIPLRESDIVWPATAQTFQLMADVKGV